MAHTLTVAGLKGGIGKTTTSVNLAAELAQRGHTVRLVDLDPQSSATLALGHTPAADPLEAAPQRVTLEGVPGALELLAGGRSMAHADEAEVRLHIERAAAGAEFVVLDTSPALMVCTHAAIAAADIALAPIEPAPMALTALHDLRDILRELDAPAKLRAVLVRVRSRRLLTGDVLDLLEADYPGALYDERVPEDVKAAEAPGYGEPLCTYAPTSRAAESYRALAQRVALDLESLGAES